MVIYVTTRSQCLRRDRYPLCYRRSGLFLCDRFSSLEQNVRLKGSVLRATFSAIFSRNVIALQVEVINLPCVMTSRAVIVFGAPRLSLQNKKQK